MKNIEFDLSKATGRQISLRVLEKLLQKHIRFESIEGSSSWSTALIRSNIVGWSFLCSCVLLNYYDALLRPLLYILITVLHQHWKQVSLFLNKLTWDNIYNPITPNVKCQIILAQESNHLTISQKPQLSLIALTINLRNERLVVRRPPSGRPLTTSRIHRWFIFLSTICYSRILMHTKSSLLTTYRFTTENFQNLNSIV